MSDKRATLRERTQRFRRRMRGQNKAVSPVVATLILILIAVAAAAALYLWLVAWQGNITGGIGNQPVQATFTIGGSTSVYPFSSLAVSWYEQNHSDVAIQDDQGGTGAGMLSVCEGHVDVGAASTPETVSGLQSADNCPSTPGITITTIAYDAVDVVINSANPHGILSVNWDTLTAIYDGASTTTPTLLNPSIDGISVSSGPLDAAPFSTHAALAWDQIPAAVFGATVGTYTETNIANSTLTAQTETSSAAVLTGQPVAVTTTTVVLPGTISFAGTTSFIQSSFVPSGLADTDFACTVAADCTFGAITYGTAASATYAAGIWTYPFTVAVTVTAATTASYTGAANAASLSYSTYQAAAPIAIGPASDTVACTGFADDLCAIETGTAAFTVSSPCGFLVCAGGTTAYPGSAAIVPIERSDASGTTQTFEAKLLGATSSSGFAGSFSALGYSGCGSNNLLSDCGITLKSSEQANGNPGVLTAVAASENNIGYASDGLARTATGIGTGGIVPFLAVGQSVGSGLVASPGSGTSAYGAVVPTTGATGTIAAGILNSATVDQYSGWRPFEFVTLQPPAGEVQDFFTYITAPDVNQNLATATGEVSIYSI